MPPYGRGNSPPPEIRPLAEDGGHSPGHHYSHQHYQHHPNPGQPASIAVGAPAPAAALAAAEAAARERDDRAPTGFKRNLDSDDEYKIAHKRNANGETRSRLEDSLHHRQSPPDRAPSRGLPRRESSETRRDEQRRAADGYHPSEVAHLPPTQSIHHQQPAQDHLPSMVEQPRDERREPYESAARKMDVDEDYDDDAEDEKRVGSGGRNSPQRGINGQPKIET